MTSVRHTRPPVPFEKNRGVGKLLAGLLFFPTLLTLAAIIIPPRGTTQDPAFVCIMGTFGFVMTLLVLGLWNPKRYWFVWPLPAGAPAT